MVSEDLNRNQEMCQKPIINLWFYDTDIYVIFLSSTWPFWKKINGQWDRPFPGRMGRHHTGSFDSKVTAVLTQRARLGRKASEARESCRSEGIKGELLKKPMLGHLGSRVGQRTGAVRCRGSIPLSNILPLSTYILCRLASGPASRLLSLQKAEVLTQNDQGSLCGPLALQHKAHIPPHAALHRSPVLSLQNQPDGL